MESPAASGGELLASPGSPRQGDPSVWLWSGAILAFSLVAVLALAGPRLDAQGASHDEIYQVPAAFTWVGQPPWMFCNAPLAGICTFNMPYSGALKSAIFGVYMRATGARWTLVRWRVLGLLLLGSGIGLLGVVAYRRLGLVPATLVVLLCVTDTRLLVASRYDGSSAALGFLLRSALLSAWLLRGAGSSGAAAVLGALAGLAAYDKLHALALVPAVAVLLAAEGRRGLARRAVAASAGFLVGAAPVVVAHAVQWVENGSIWALSGRELAPGTSAGSTAGYIWRLATIGSITSVEDVPVAPAQLLAEGLCFSAALLLVAVLAARRRLPRVAVILAAWVAVAASLAILPVTTRSYHWILVTPFVYLALAAAMARHPVPDRRRLAARLLPLVATAWLLVRGAGLAAVEPVLWQGVASPEHHPNYTRVARHVAETRPDDVWVVGHWGIGNSLFCEGQGRPGRVFEAYRWPPGSVRSWLAARREDHVYFVTLEPGTKPLVPQATARLLAELRAAPGWIETEPEMDLRQVAPVLVHRFERRR